MLAAYREARGTNQPIIAQVLPNGVHVIIMPNGNMHNLHGEDAIERFMAEHAAPENQEDTVSEA